MANRALSKEVRGDETLSDDVIDEEVETRVHRTTIVPLPLDDLESDPTCQTSPLLDPQGELELDEPDLFDPDFENPTRIGRQDRFKSARPDSVAVKVSTSDRQTAPPVAAPALAKPALAHEPLRGRRTISEIRSRHGNSDRPDADHPNSDKWYLRVQLDTECVADLWIRDLTPHNVLVWSSDMESWVPLLTVRELRDAIRDAHDAKTREELNEANFVFVNTQAKGTHQKPLPEPRLPASMVAPLVARPTSHWSQPKARTISNVPPPLLTTAVPVVATGQPSLAPPRVPQTHLNPRRTSQPPPLPVEQRRRTSEASPPRQSPASAAVAPFAAPRASLPAVVLPPFSPTQFAPASVIAPTTSTVPPVVTSVGSKLGPVLDSEPGSEVGSEPELEYLPSIPRPARLPTVQEKSAPPPRSLVANAAARLNARTNWRARVERVLPLVHVERALWLAAGVAVASATMLLTRDPNPEIAAEPPGRAAANRIGQDPGNATEPGTGPGTASRAASPDSMKSPERSDVPRVEDLPVVGHGGLARGTSAKALKAGRYSGRQQANGAVAAVPVTLATSSKPANSVSTSGDFDTATARRVLSSSANRASRCASDGPASGSVVVTFAPTGFVQSASISGLSGQGVNVGCVVRAFQEARVTPFGGASVTVRKSFQIL